MSFVLKIKPSADVSYQIFCAINYSNDDIFSNVLRFTMIKQL